jgi:hypothetical protein
LTTSSLGSGNGKILFNFLLLFQKMTTLCTSKLKVFEGQIWPFVGKKGLSIFFILPTHMILVNNVCWMQKTRPLNHFCVLKKMLLNTHTLKKGLYFGPQCRVVRYPTRNSFELDQYLCKKLIMVKTCLKFCITASYLCIKFYSIMSTGTGTDIYRYCITSNIVRKL